MTNPNPKDRPTDANETCVGPTSSTAGTSESCQGCPNQNICKSNNLSIDPDIQLIAKSLENVKRKIVILSGKGGVGKSTFSTNLSFAVSVSKTVGLLDTDITGPSLPRMVGLINESIHTSNSGWCPVYLNDNLGVMSIGFMLEQSNSAVIWRGPKKNGLIKQFLRDVDWGDLDYLFIDTPPGTSDEHLSIAQYLKDSGIDGAIIITTPQEVSLQDVRKEISFCNKVGIPIIGVVENMSGFVCPNCNIESLIFPPTTGGAVKMASEMNVPFLGSIPIDPRIAKSCDLGVSFLDQYPDSIAYKAYMNILEKIEGYFK